MEDPKKEKDDKERFEGWTREQMIQHIKDLENWFEKEDKSKKSKYRYIRNHNVVSVQKYCNELRVSKSGYYNWLQSGEKETGNYDEKLLEQIKFLFYLKKQKFGFKRLKILLEKEFNVFVNINTVRRYMLFLGIKANIRQPKKNKEIKITNKSHNDLIKRNRNASKPYQKLFTDVSYIRTNTGWSYLSVVLDSFNNEVIGWRFSKFNNNEFVYNSIRDSIMKIDNPSETIIHSDHGYQYFQPALEIIRAKFGFKQSMGRIGISLDNRPIEYFFSILKQEYLFGKALSFEETYKKN